MRLLCLAIGKKHDSSIATAVDDYTKRLQHYTPLDWQLLPPAKGKMGIDETKRAESAQLLAQIKDDDYVVLLDEDGVQLASSDLARMLDALDMRASRRAVFIIGGAFGVVDQLRKRADIVWSLSNLTFPHQLVRLILAEQLYRASTIRRDEPYHHQ
jgi:23S rRNA (pseudouridine1915-N3)-methyltransferase